MGNQVPDVAMFVVFKWAIILMIGAGMAQLASLLVKKWWYSTEKHDRRGDTDESRGWISRFLENQAAHTEAVVALERSMDSILKALEKNGEIIKDFAEKHECKYDEHRRR